MKRFFIAALFLVPAIFTLSCKKFLDQKPDGSLAIPSTLRDLQALLDNDISMNSIGKGLGEACSDNYYLTQADFNSLNDANKNIYTWGDEYNFEGFPNEWFSAYRVVYVSNLVLETLPKIDRAPDNAAAWDHVKGSALFFRGSIFHFVVINWAKAFDPSTASTDPGIPLRMTTDFNQRSTRASNLETYNQVISDLKGSIPLLPEHPDHVMRPSRTAAYSMLARVYLSMRNYTDARKYADSALLLKNVLLNYNSLSPSAAWPVPQFNKEVIFHLTGSAQTLTASRAKIDSNLYASYHQDDLRKTIFFKNNNNGSYAFKGSYSGNSALFVGLSTNENYFMLAECQARNGQFTEAMNTLNSLLSTRWKTGTYVPFTASSSNEALDIILRERRKELLMRDLRWMDIKRLNMEGAGIIQQRFINNELITLPPNHNKYAMPIFEYVIEKSGIAQNPK